VPRKQPHFPFKIVYYRGIDRALSFCISIFWKTGMDISTPLHPERGTSALPDTCHPHRKYHPGQLPLPLTLTHLSGGGVADGWGRMSRHGSLRGDARARAAAWMTAYCRVVVYTDDARRRNLTPGRPAPRDNR